MILFLIWKGMIIHEEVYIGYLCFDARTANCLR